MIKEGYCCADAKANKQRWKPKKITHLLQMIKSGGGGDEAKNKTS